MTFLYDLDKIIQTALEVDLEQALGTSTQGTGRKKRLIREGTTKFTKLAYHCGVTKKTQEDLDDHGKRKHANNHWHCIFDNFQPLFKSVYNYSLKKNMCRISTTRNFTCIASTVSMAQMRSPS